MRDHTPRQGGRQSREVGVCRGLTRRRWCRSGTDAAPVGDHDGCLRLHSQPNQFPGSVQALRSSVTCPARMSSTVTSRVAITHLHKPTVVDHSALRPSRPPPRQLSHHARQSEAEPRQRRCGDAVRRLEALRHRSGRATACQLAPLVGYMHMQVSPGARSRPS